MERAETAGESVMSQALRDYAGNYHIRGKSYKSITTILKEECPKVALDNWKERTPDWPVKARKAAIYGTFMHLQLQHLYADIPPDVPSEMPMEDWPDDMAEELEGRMESWLALGLQFEKPNMIEHTVVVEQHNELGDVMAAGTWDYWGKVDGMKTILDWKSSKNPQKSHRLQMGAYYLGALAEGYEVEWGMIPYVHKNNVTLVEMQPDELYEAGEKFLEIARKSYRKVNGIST